jgi:hypothetical protein
VTESTSHFETIATFTGDDGNTYEIDHLGIGYPDTQWGNFAVYRDGEMVEEFCIPEHGLKPEFRPAAVWAGLPVTEAELTDLARQAAAGNYASDEEVAAYFETTRAVG